MQPIRYDQQGMTLIEVMIACLMILTSMIVGGAIFSFLYVNMSEQSNRRAAIEYANNRLEQLRALDAGAIQPPALTTNLYYLAEEEGEWRHSASDPDEQITIFGRHFPIRTTLCYMNLDGDSSSYDGLHLTVHIKYGAMNERSIKIETFYAL